MTTAISTLEQDNSQLLGGAVPHPMLRIEAQQTLSKPEEGGGEEGGTQHAHRSDSNPEVQGHHVANFG